MRNSAARFESNRWVTLKQCASVSKSVMVLTARAEWTNRKWAASTMFSATNCGKARTSGNVWAP
jgi:hypothetical protein